MVDPVSEVLTYNPANTAKREGEFERFLEYQKKNLTLHSKIHLHIQQRSKFSHTHS